MKRPRSAVIRVVLSITILFAALRLVAGRQLELLDRWVFNLRVQQRGPLRGTDAVTIVAVDQNTCGEVTGRWPWPRRQLAIMVARLAEAGAKTIAFDVLFSKPDDHVDRRAFLQGAERDPASAEALWASLQAANDAALEAAILASQRVVLGYVAPFGQPGTSPASSPDPGVISEVEFDVVPGADLLAIPEAGRLDLSIPLLRRAASGSGYATFTQDADGQLRRVPMVMRVGDRVGAALGLETVRRFEEDSTPKVRLEPWGVGGLDVGGHRIPVDETGALWINYLGPPGPARPSDSPGTFTYLRACDVIDGAFPADAVRGRIALVGTTFAGDRYTSPFSVKMPGVEVHATVIDNILEGRALLRPAWVIPLEAGAVLLLGVLVALLLCMPGIWGFIGIAGLLTAWIWGTQRLFTTRGIVVSAVYPLAAIVFQTLGGTVVRYLGERRIRDVFRPYLNPEVVNLLVREPDSVRLGGDRCEVTIFFSDIRGFTTSAEALQQRSGPEAVAKLMNEYLGEMTKILFEHEGLLDKYIGDAVMAIWGAPVAVPDHAARACRTALHMLDALAPLNERWRTLGWPHVAIGIGIDTGEVVIGNFGSATRFNYTAIGDHVNLASRLEGLNKTYHTRVLLTETTRRAVGDEFVYREVDRVEVKGKHESVTIYELLGPLAADTDGSRRRLAADFAEVLAAYRARDWDAAEARIARLTTEWGCDGPSAELARRIQDLRAAPPGDDWDGVYRPKEK